MELSNIITESSLNKDARSEISADAELLKSIANLINIDTGKSDIIS